MERRGVLECFFHQNRKPKPVADLSDLLLLRAVAGHHRAIGCDVGSVRRPWLSVRFALIGTSAPSTQCAFLSRKHERPLFQADFLNQWICKTR